MISNYIKNINILINNIKKPQVHNWIVASVVKIKYLLSTFKIVHAVEDTYDFTKNEVKQEGW